MITIYFESHAPSLDNLAGLASGQYDVELSDLGRQQAASEMALRYAQTELDAVFTSDTRRAYETAQIMFQGREIPIIQDARLRECDYGDMTRHPRPEVETAKPKFVRTPFPNGESYDQIMQRMRSFLDDLKKNHDGKTLLIISHQATLHGLEHWVKGKPVLEILAARPRAPLKYEF